MIFYGDFQSVDYLIGKVLKKHVPGSPCITPRRGSTGFQFLARRQGHIQIRADP